MDEERKQSTMDRRRLLKRAGIGIAAAWTAPMVLGSAAGAAASGLPGGKTCARVGLANGNNFPCQHCPACSNDCTPPGQNNCCCFVGVDGCCFCGQNTGCQAACSRHADCPPGWKCVYTCCAATLSCVPPCGTFPGSPAAAGARMSGTG